MSGGRMIINRGLVAPDDIFEVEEGQFFYVRDPSSMKVKRIGMWIPGTDSPVLLVVDDVVMGEAAWMLSGTEEEPTLMPSVFINPPDGWHGFITNGVAEAV